MGRVRTDCSRDLIPGLALLLSEMEVPTPKGMVEEAVLTNPAYPGLSSAVQALRTWKIAAEVIRCPPRRLPHLVYPCIALLRRRERPYVVIRSASELAVEVVGPSFESISVPRTEFEEMWTGVVLLAEPKPGAKENHRSFRWRAEARKEVVRRAVVGSWLGLGALVLGALLYSLRKEPVPFGLVLVKGIGIGLTSFLLLPQIFPGSQVFAKLCPPSPRLDCSSVLRSSGAKLFKVLPVADLGWLYFSGGLLTLGLASLAGRGTALLWFFSGLAFAALPYTFFSFFYQWKVVRKWCWLCLAVCSLFWVEAGLLLGRFGAVEFALGGPESLCLAIGFGFPVLLLSLKPRLAQSSAATEWRHLYLRLKRDPDLIERSLEPPVLPPELEVVLRKGAVGALVDLVVVTQFDCPHCARAHRHAEEILDAFGEAVSVEFRLLVPEPQGESWALAREVLAMGVDVGVGAAWRKLAEGMIGGVGREEPGSGSRDGDPSGPGADIREEAFSIADEVLRKTGEWARGERLRGTPTFFANGRRVPMGYDLEDLVPWIAKVIDSGGRGRVSAAS